MEIQITSSKLGLMRLKSHIIELSLIGAGILLLAWVGSITWTDITYWAKDIGSIFFGSRTGEPISLDIGMTLFNYFLIGLALIGTGTIVLLKNHILTAKPEFEVPIKSPKVKTPIPQNKNKLSSEIKTTLKKDNAAAQEERFFSGCLHHFGYLSSRPKDSPIPQECILCQRLGDCMVATVYIPKLNK